MNTLKPTTIDEVRDVLATAASDKRTLEIRGGGTKSAIGRPARDTIVLDMSAFNSVIDYDPKELVLTVGAGAKLSEIEKLIAAENQMLAFEPFDHGPLFGKEPDATIGGIVSVNVAGSRRLSAGSARDHTLGFEGVSGRGEVFKGGGRVVKNVTGYDLPKLLTGSWGRLAALTAITLKVLPRPRTSATVVVRGLTDERAVAAMAEAAGSAAEISGATHCPFGDNAPMTAIRVEGFGPSVDARAASLARILRPYGTVEILSVDASTDLWQGIRDLTPLGIIDPTWLLWRINGRPSRCWSIPAKLTGARWFYDWAGGLIWLAAPIDTATVRRVAVEAGAHATLIRAPDSVRATVPALHPSAPAVEALAGRVKAAFDPAGILDPHRFQA